MPRLWNQTIEAHRHEVREAILDATWALVSEHGPTAVTMSQIAERAGIGRATLYKYFPDVESILIAWHERHVTAHLEHLAVVRDRAGDAGERLQVVLQAYAAICYHRGQRGGELFGILHRGEHVVRAHHHLHELVRDLVADAAAAGLVRDDLAPDELAGYCLHAVSAAGSLPTEDAAHRLSGVVLDGLRTPV